MIKRLIKYIRRGIGNYKTTKLVKRPAGSVKYPIIRTRDYDYEATK